MNVLRIVRVCLIDAILMSLPDMSNDGIVLVETPVNTPVNPSTTDIVLIGNMLGSGVHSATQLSEAMRRSTIIMIGAGTHVMEQSGSMLYHDPAPNVYSKHSPMTVPYRTLGIGRFCDRGHIALCDAILDLCREQMVRSPEMRGSHASLRVAPKNAIAA